MNVDYYLSDVTSYSDYYPFGMLQPNRHDGQYTYGYQGSEADNEVKGKGNSYTTQFRSYDSRLGRWLSTDPLHNLAPGWNPYRFGFDNPVVFMDKTGLFETKKEAKQYKKEHSLKGKLHKSDDGIYTIDNEKAGTSMFKDASLDDIAISTRQDDGVIVDVLVTVYTPSIPQ